MSASRPNQEFKHHNRVALEAETANLYEQLEKNNKALINLYSNFFSILAWPLFYRLLLNSDSFFSLREFFGSFHKEVVFHALDQQFPGANIAEDQKTIGEFETSLQDMTQNLYKMPLLSPAFDLLKSINPELKSINDILKLPNRLADLKGITSDSSHLIYIVAGLVDHLYKQVKNPNIHNRFHNIFAIISKKLPRPLLPQEQALMPEYRGFGLPPNLIPGETSCYRYATLIHMFIKDYLDDKKFLDETAEPYILLRLNDQLFWLACGIALSIKLLSGPILNHITKSNLFKTVSQSRFSQFLYPQKFNAFATTNTSLSEMKSPKTYRFLESEELLDERDLLKKTIRHQKPSSTSYQNMNLLIGFMFLTYCYSLFERTSWSDAALAISPMVATLTAKSTLDWGLTKVKTYKKNRKMQQLEKELHESLEIIKTHYKIYNYSNYLILDVTQGYQNLSPQHVASIIKLVLHHFDVQLRLHDDNQLSIDPEAKLPVNAANTFNTTLTSAVQQPHLTEQLLGLMKEPNLKQCNLEPFFQTEQLKFGLILTFAFKLNDQAKERLLLIKGLKLYNDRITIIRETALSQNEIGHFRKALARTEQKSSASAYSSPAYTTAKQSSKSSSQQLADNKDHKSTAVSIPATPRAREIAIDWGNSLRFPDERIRPLENAPNRFILWDLPLDQFENKSAHDAFHPHSSRLAASSRDKQGIKHGLYLGENYHNNGRQEYFPARVKLSSSRYGMWGVLLSVHEAENNGAILYRTCDYRKVH